MSATWEYARRVRYGTTCDFPLAFVFQPQACWSSSGRWLFGSVRFPCATSSAMRAIPVEYFQRWGPFVWGRNDANFLVKGNLSGPIGDLCCGFGSR